MGRLKIILAYGVSIYFLTVISMVKTYILHEFYGIINKTIFCPELLIALILTQIYVIYTYKEFNTKNALVKLTILNLFLTIFAWTMGTAVIASPWGIGH